MKLLSNKKTAKELAYFSSMVYGWYQAKKMWAVDSEQVMIWNNIKYISPRKPY